MSDLKIFKNEEFGEVRVIEVDGEPWFVGKDVAESLGYKDAPDALKKHVFEEDKLTRQIADSGQNRLMYIINESGLYSLILSSKLPNAKKFKRWVTNEVLPQIRKTGGYIPVNKEDDDMTILIKAVGIYEKTLKEKNTIISELEPKAKEFDALMSGKGTYSMNHTAKIFGIGQNKLFKILRDSNVLLKRGTDNVPYQKFLDMGYFEVVASYDRRGVLHSVTRVTPYGIKYISDLLRNCEGEYISEVKKQYPTWKSVRYF